MNKNKDIKTEKKRDPSRREFIEMSSMAGIGTVLGIHSIPSVFNHAGHPKLENNDDARALHIHPRYHRWFVDPGVEWIETNTGYASLDWKIPYSQAALVLVD